MLDSGSKGEKIFIYIVIIIGILGVGAIVYENCGTEISSFFKDPIVGDWKCVMSVVRLEPIGVQYHFDGDGSYTSYLIIGNNTSYYSDGFWKKINDGYYKTYDANGKLEGYFTYDNDWLYSDTHSYHRIN